MKRLNGRARYLIEASDAEDAIDRASRLPDGHDASRMRAKPAGPGRFVVRFLVPPQGKRQVGPGLARRGPCSKCDHPVDDHYHGSCMTWGCGVCA